MTFIYTIIYNYHKLLLIII